MDNLLKNIRNNSGIVESKELLPNQASKSDKNFLKKLKLLYRIGDKEEFNKSLKRLNFIRKSEGLPELHKNEIFSKETSKVIKNAIKKDKLKQKEDNSKKDKVLSKMFYTHEYYTNIKKREKYKTNVQTRKIINDSNLGINLDDLGEKTKKSGENISFYIVRVNGEKVYILSTTGIYLGEPINKIIKVKSNLKHKVQGTTIILPEINKKIDIIKNDLLKIKKL